MPEPTPGEIAYTAYWQRVFATLEGLCPFEGLPSDHQAGWEAAAQAVLAMRKEDTPHAQ